MARRIVRSRHGTDSAAFRTNIADTLDLVAAYGNKRRRVASTEMAAAEVDNGYGRMLERLSPISAVGGTQQHCKFAERGRSIAESI